MRPILLITCFFFFLEGNAQISLTPGQEFSKEMGIGETHTYMLKIKKGEFYKLLIMQDGIDLQIIVKLPGMADTVFDSPNGTAGPEPVEFLANADAQATLNVSPLDDPGNPKKGKYSIKYTGSISAADYSNTLLQKEKEQKEWVDWIKKTAVPLKTVKAGTGFSDLEWLGPVLKNKKIVALGEATHGTKEFFQMKHRLLEWLVTKLGFTVFAIEASYGRCKYINEYILTGKGNLDTATVIQGFTTWSTEEVKEMIQWMRNYNIANPAKKIQFVGFDLQVNDAVAYQIANYYGKVDAGKKITVDTLLKKVQAAEMRGGIFSGDTTIRTLIKPVESLIADLVEKRSDYILRSSKAEYEEILWDEKVLLQYIVSYSYNNFAAIIKKQDRDYYMAQNVLTWLSYFPKETKMVLWAHNGHIAKDFLDAVAIPSMGNYLKKELKEDYYAIGFDFYSGTFRSNDVDLKDSPGWETNEVGAAPEGSLSSFFVKAGLNDAVIEFSQTAQNAAVKKWLNEKQVSTYSMGSQFSKKWSLSSYNAPMHLQHAFDAVIVIKKSNSSDHVKRFKIDRYSF